jgi:Peptidase inhibitor I78 family
MKRIIGVVGLALLTGFAGAFGVLGNGDSTAQPPDTCGASAYEALIGQPRAILDATEFSQPVRVIPFGRFVTLEYLPDRINFELDRGDLVTRIYCG